MKSPVTVISTESRQGLAHALNVGISQGSCKYIARIDVGDSCTIERLEVQKRHLEHHSDIDLIGIKSSLQYFSQDGRLLRTENSVGPLEHPQVVKQLKRRNPLIHGSIMFRRSCFQECGGYDEDLLVAQDFGLYMKFYQKDFKFTILDEAEHTHRFYLGRSNTLLKNRLSRWNAMKLRIKYLNVRDLLDIGFLIYFLKDLAFLIGPENALQKIRNFLK